jgi:DNA helicase-2/ATP-dependent DNA helicase PcrA
MLEEERRLFYVGITRAEEKLYLTHAKSRRRNGELLPSVPSSFFQNVPPELLEQRVTMRLRASGRTAFNFQTPSERRPGQRVSFGGSYGSLGSSRAPREVDEAELSQDAPVFVKGARVRHARFGSGTIAELSGVGRDTKVTIDFDDETVGRKKLVVAYAGLERGDE